MTSQLTELGKAIMHLISEYEKAKEADYIRKPISYALYQTWKTWDSKEESREIEAAGDADMSNFSKERDKAFIKAVMEDEWEAVRKFSKKYGVLIPWEESKMMAGVYKAVQHCTDIPEEVKNVAMVKCLKLGFSPLIKPIEESEDGE